MIRMIERLMKRRRKSCRLIVVVAVEVAWLSTWV